MRLAFVSTYPPRRCGLAAFTADLRSALAVVEPKWDLAVCAIDRDGLEYGPEVQVVIRQDDAADYRRAARTLAAARVDLVVIQHEYGIFGGPDGNYILEFTDELRLLGVRFVVTLHTVLAQPNRGQEATLAALCRGCARITVFTRGARVLVQETGVADPLRVVVVPHGAPSVLRSRVEPSVVGAPLASALAWVGNNHLLTTFGLIGPGKGIEDAVSALSMVARRIPDTRYLVAGTTHPEVARHGGDTYRDQLRSVALRCGVGDRVYFLDAYLTEAELGALLQRTDIFLTPYQSPHQMCSGALTFALAAGRPVVSTAFRYAVEMLSSNGAAAAGVLVPCRDVAGLADAVVHLLADPCALSKAREAADAQGATLMWPRVATRFADVFTAAANAPVLDQPAATPPMGALRLDHLSRLTDEIGIVQFARGTRPDPQSGYCVDDMARLAIVASNLQALLPTSDVRPGRWLATALGFLRSALAPDGMHNLLGPDNAWRDVPAVGDHVGRAIWALGTVSAVGGRSAEAAAGLLDRTTPLVSSATAPRTLAYTILGLALGTPSPACKAVIATSADHLEAPLRTDPNMLWYEPRLTYDNARLPHAVLMAGAVCGDSDRVARALSALDWYADAVGLGRVESGYLRCVGNSWRDATAAGPEAGEGDEQPIDAAAMVEALVSALLITGDRSYARLAKRAFAWFYGANRAGVAVYDAATGGCRDGLSATDASDNEGAESTLAYYQALLAMLRSGLISLPLVQRLPLATPPPPRASTRSAPTRVAGAR